MTNQQLIPPRDLLNWKSLLWFLILADYFFDPVLQGTPGQHNPVTTCKAFKPNIRTKADDLPLISPAGMLLS
jgi:hypothetical protein